MSRTNQTGRSLEESARARALASVTDEVITCRKCSRLVEWRERSANSSRAALRDEIYWAKAVPAFGDLDARLLIVGLAPAAHGANRTGRMFTGDRSGDFLFHALHRVGYANQPTSTSKDDGLHLHDVYISAVVRCAPPENRPTPAERDACTPYLSAEIVALTNVRVTLALGTFAFDALVREFVKSGRLKGPIKSHRFAHGAEFPLLSLDGTEQAGTLLCSYHPSQRNVFTGLLTAEAFEAVLRRARVLSANTRR